MSAALTEKEICFVVKALIEGTGLLIQGDLLESLCRKQTAFLSVFLDGVLDGEASEYRRGDDLNAAGKALLEKLRALSPDQRETLVRGAADTQKLCGDGGMTVEQALHSEKPPPPVPVAKTPPEEQFGRCPCSNCEVNIEFPLHGIGQSITCPKCGCDTVLFDAAKDE
jgi:hypothetical protein